MSKLRQLMNAQFPPLKPCWICGGIAYNLMSCGTIVCAECCDARSDLAGSRDIGAGMNFQVERREDGGITTTFDVNHRALWDAGIRRRFTLTGTPADPYWEIIDVEKPTTAES